MAFELGLFLKIAKLETALKSVGLSQGDESGDPEGLRREMAAGLVDLASLLSSEGKDFIARKHLRRVADMGQGSLITGALKGLGVH